MTSLLEEIALVSGTAFSFESEVLACAVSARVGESVCVEDDDTSDSEEFVSGENGVKKGVNEEAAEERDDDHEGSEDLDHPVNEEDDESNLESSRDVHKSLRVFGHDV